MEFSNRILGILIALSGISVSGHYYYVHYLKGMINPELILPAIITIVIGVYLVQKNE